jgi:hypothetical protein
MVIDPGRRIASRGLLSGVQPLPPQQLSLVRTHSSPDLISRGYYGSWGDGKVPDARDIVGIFNLFFDFVVEDIHKSVFGLVPRGLDVKTVRSFICVVELRKSKSADDSTDLKLPYSKSSLTSCTR